MMQNKNDKWRQSLAILTLASLVFSFLPPLPVRADNTLFVDISANPSQGTAPLSNVSLSATVSGTAQGPITYRFDCTSDGVWELVTTSNNTTYTASNLCNYSNPGNYTATVKVERDNGSFQGTIAILVQQQPPPTVDLKANGSDGPITIPFNISATLSWTSTNATSCTASGGWSGTKATAGSEQTTNLTTSQTYAISCTGPGGTANDSVIVNVSNPVPTVDIKLNGSDGPVTLAFNTSGILSWTSTNATSCLASGGWAGSKATTGSEQTANLTNSQTFTITCTGPGGSASDSVTVNVQSPAPTVDIKANGSDGPVTVEFNTAATLSWVSTNATSCSASGDWLGAKTVSGSESTGFLTTVRTFTYTLTCSGPGGTAVDSVSVNVNAPRALYVTLEANPNAGNAPLNGVSLRATVAGTATGPIAYSFDCQGNGVWDIQVTSNNPQYQTGPICNYANAGQYRPRVQVARNNFTIRGNATIYVSVPGSSVSVVPTLFVDLQAQPNTGASPLVSTLTALVSGTATGNTTFSFDCTSDGVWDNVISTSNSTASFSCTYQPAGTYLARVKAERAGLLAAGTTAIMAQ